MFSDIFLQILSEVHFKESCRNSFMVSYWNYFRLSLQNLRRNIFFVDFIIEVRVFSTSSYGKVFQEFLNLPGIFQEFEFKNFQAIILETPHEISSGNVQGIVFWYTFWNSSKHSPENMPEIHPGIILWFFPEFFQSFHPTFFYGFLSKVVSRIASRIIDGLPPRIISKFRCKLVYTKMYFFGKWGWISMILKILHNVSGITFTKIIYIRKIWIILQWWTCLL